MSWFQLHLDNPQDWKSSSELGDWVHIYIRKSWLGGLDQFIIKWTVKWIQYLFCGSLYLRRRDGWWCTNDVWLNWLWTFNVGICKYQGKFLVHDYCGRIEGINDFFTISCMLNWGIGSMSVNNEIILNVNMIIVSRWTAKLLLLHGCFLREYLAW